MTVEAFYLTPGAGPSGRRFCLYYPPAAGMSPRGAVVYIHPFAEEMNKARRMAALQARAMAKSGYAVLQIDLFGCGDSAGDFGEATWTHWLADVELACDWLQARRKDESVDFWLWGLRTGCLLAAQAAARRSRPCNLLLWQPVVSGKQFLQQFLRLKVAGEALAGESKGAMARLREQLAQGCPVEIGGYLLSPALAEGLEMAELAAPPAAGRVEWLELSGRMDGILSPVAKAKIDQWRAAGSCVRGSAVAGPAFWQTVEIAECPALIDASLRAMKSAKQP
ncbi:hydrolase 2, exosortase A system-associated [Propionivibrio limicola]|uniref:hydrolase 2, exosortase A system-associated n=1 Tax=Propionivibrio limicola TaxID=167645 RepID=UPI001292AC25|nr:hydrolase 2, exosortase A system-associated [Propionivibrio limicola]